MDDGVSVRGGQSHHHPVYTQPPHSTACGVLCTAPNDRPTGPIRPSVHFRPSEIGSANARTHSHTLTQTQYVNKTHVRSSVQTRASVLGPGCVVANSLAGWLTRRYASFAAEMVGLLCCDRPHCANASATVRVPVILLCARVRTFVHQTAMCMYCSTNECTSACACMLNVYTCPQAGTGWANVSNNCS